MSKVTFHTGVGTVTGANFLLECDSGTKILIDCGLVQGERVANEENREAFGYDTDSVSALIITHAHLDHVGRIPLLVKSGFAGTIYSTPETRSLAEVVLNDAVNILGLEAKQESIEPLYLPSDIPPVFTNWKTVEYHESFDVGGATVRFKDAGHILGSSMVEIVVDGKKILFTGDLGNSPAPLLRDTEPVEDADYLIMESVYGDRNHESKEDREIILERIIRRVVNKGGTLVIPAFAIDRTQVLLFELNNLIETGKIPSIPVFLDSPMAIKATEIYKASTDLFNLAVQAQMARGDNVLDFPHLEFTLTANESRAIESVSGPKIILAGSGMSMGGRIVGHEADYLPDNKNTILLVGYQAAGSLGRQLADGAKKIRYGRNTIKVKAEIETLYGFSAHRDSDHLVEFVSTGTDKLKQVFVVMGEPRSSMHLAQRLNNELGVKAFVPERGKEYTI